MEQHKNEASGKVVETIDNFEDPRLHLEDCHFLNIIQHKISWITYKELEDSFYAEEIPESKCRKPKTIAEMTRKGYSEKEFQERLAKVKEEASPKLKEEIQRKLWSPAVMSYIQSSWKDFEDYKEFFKQNCKCPAAQMYRSEQLEEAKDSAAAEIEDLENNKSSGEGQGTSIETDKPGEDVIDKTEETHGTVEPYEEELPEVIWLEFITPSGELRACNMVKENETVFLEDIKVEREDDSPVEPIHAFDLDLPADEISSSSDGFDYPPFIPPPSPPSSEESSVDWFREDSQNQENVDRF